MTKQTRVKSSRFEKMNGLPCAVLVCEDGAEVIIPAEAFLVLAAQARQHLNSTKTDLVAGEWVPARYQPVNQIRPGTTDDGRVALQFDPGTDAEILLSLDPKTARDLGQALANAPLPDPSLSKKH
jgi:hypothetical protein